MSGVRGICPQCGACYYYGQALSNLHDQTCSNCGHILEIFKDGVRIETDHSSGTTKAPSDQTRSKSDNKYVKGKTK